MNVLLSIKPCFSNLIFSGLKKYEYRRAIFKNPEVRKIIVYESSPTKMIVGEFNIEVIIRDTPNELWNKTKKHSGVDGNLFFSYFKKCQFGYAIKIKSSILYPHPIDPKKIIPDFHAPQSFIYLLQESLN